MSVNKLVAIGMLLLAAVPIAGLAKTPPPEALTPLTQEEIASNLGWVIDPNYECGGYYLEAGFDFPETKQNDRHATKLTSKNGLLAQHGTSNLDGLTITRAGQQITADQAYLYRNPDTYQLVAAEMIGDVHLREPNTLIIAKRGRYHFESSSKSLLDIIYRTSLSGRQVVGPDVAKDTLRQSRRNTLLTAWGIADEASQTEPQIYELSQASFSTCPPLNPAWRVKGSRIVINKQTGRGQVTNVRIYVKQLPVFYFPYIDFSIDHQRKTGFLWPTFGVGSGQSRWGPYVLAPFYMNLAPNYDMTVTPGFLSQRGFQLNDEFRYLTRHSNGVLNVSVLPGDKEFAILQETYNNLYAGAPDPIGAELNRLLNSSTTRKSLAWRDSTHFDNNWSSHIDFNYAGDDYYMQDFGVNSNEVTQNQLLQEADLYFKNNHWDFTGRLQTYQTLHPIIEGQPAVSNQYRRFPQLILNGDFPDRQFGLDYFINTDLTHFDIRNTPGTAANQPIGNRLHVQPGISLPLYLPYFYINPRIQLALTDYQLYQTADTGAPTAKRRALPIFDVASGLAFNRETTLFEQTFQQTFEPQIYYTYIPYRNQASIPVFDTTVNTLTYDELFNYNRFSGIDRIGDANQIGIGVTSRFIDETTGLEKVRIGAGEIIYFANRLVTLCNDNACTDNPNNHSNYQKLSPLTALLNYHVNQDWNMNANAIWNPVSKQIANSSIQFQYRPNSSHIINLGYSYVFNGDIQSGSVVNSAQNNIKITDLSIAWPVSHDVSVVGRWSEDWGITRLQNLLYGLQYDTCCWAVRLVGGKTFAQLQNNVPQYNNQIYLQFALKGLGNIGSGNPATLLNTITGYNTQFGQEI